MKHIPKKGIKIDLGCAIGTLTNEINIQNGYCLGIEPDISKLRNAKRYGMLGDFIQAVGEYIPIRNERISVVICHSVLTYVTNLQQVINEVIRVLKNKGMLLAFEFNKKNFLARRSDSKAKIYSEDEYKNMFQKKSNLKIEGNFDYVPYWIKINGLTFLFRIPEMILQRLPVSKNLGGFVKIKYEK